MASPPTAGRVLLAALLVLPVGAAAVQGFAGATDTTEIEYRMERIDGTASAEQALGVNERILTCPGQRPCELEQRVLENGSVRYEGHLNDRQRYPAVNIDGEFYLPEHAERADSVVLTLRNVSARDAAEAVSVPVSDLGPAVQTAVREGSVVTDRQVGAFERGVVVAHEGDLYWNGGTTYSYQYVDWVEMGKAAAFAAVAALLLVDVGRGVAGFWREE